MKLRKGLSAALVMLIIAFSCGKDDLTKTELLTQKPWKLTGKTISPPLNLEGYGSISDLFAIYPDCVRDDIWVFKSNGTFTQEEGATKCNQADPSVWDMGTWTFSSDESILTTSSQIYGMGEYDLLELTASSLRLRSQLIDTLDNVYTLTDSYGH